jgi:hypothetical protein
LSAAEAQRAILLRAREQNGFEAKYSYPASAVDCEYWINKTRFCGIVRRTTGAMSAPERECIGLLCREFSVEKPVFCPCDTGSPMPENPSGPQGARRLFATRQV